MPASPSSSGPFAELGEITPLTDFDWNTTEPTKIRPFKPKYHLTMGITPFLILPSHQRQLTT
jgi:hypothetical protein